MPQARWPDLRERARQGDRIDRQQILDREAQADPEHQQDDADLGELAGEIDVGDEARREGAHGDAGQQVADEWRQAQPASHEAAAEGQDQAHHDGGDEGSSAASRSPRQAAAGIASSRNRALEAPGWRCR